MSTLKSIGFVFFLVGCNFSKTSTEPMSFDSKVSDLFFNANTKAKYDDLVVYFKTIHSLQEFELGQTLYPPLSALIQEKNKIDKKGFEFSTYLDISSKLKNGTLIINKFNHTKESLAVLENTLEFKLMEDAQNFYKTCINKFTTLPKEKKESSPENIYSTLIHDNESDSFVKISLFEDQPSKLYAVTIRLIVIES